MVIASLTSSFFREMMAIAVYSSLPWIRKSIVLEAAKYVRNA